MKFSVTLGAAGVGCDPAALADLARLAEKSGWDAVFLDSPVLVTPAWPHSRRRVDGAPIVSGDARHSPDRPGCAVPR
jgi:hypothetical protein